ncbi:MAG: hypothetical protein QM758_08085 [Armatimonas sp.]
MEKEEQLSFYAAMIEDQANRLERIQSDVNNALDEIKGVAASVSDYFTGGLSWCFATIESNPKYPHLFIVRLTTYGEYTVPKVSVNVYQNNSDSEENISYDRNKRLMSSSMDNLTPGMIITRGLTKSIEAIDDSSEIKLAIQLLSPCFSIIQNLTIKKNDNKYFTDCLSQVNVIYKSHHKGKAKYCLVDASNGHTKVLSITDLNLNEK